MLLDVAWSRRQYAARFGQLAAGEMPVCRQLARADGDIAPVVSGVVIAVGGDCRELDSPGGGNIFSSRGK